MAKRGTFKSRGRKLAMCQAYARSGQVIKSCAKVGITHVTHYRWLESDPIYAADWEVAGALVTERLEDSMMARAVDGWDEPTGWYRGVAGGTVTRYSDNLAMFVAKGRRPDRYRENYSVDVRHTHAIDADGARQQLAALIERSPELASVVRGLLPTSDPIDAECVEVEGGGPPQGSERVDQ